MAESADILSGAAPAGDPAEPRRRLLDGRHGQARRCRGLLGRRWPTLGIDEVVPITYMNSAASLKAFCGRNGGIVCTSSNAPQVSRLGVRARREDPLLPGPAPRPQHRRQRRASRSTRWSSGTRSSRSAATRPKQLRRRDGHPLEGLLLGPRALLGRADRAGPRETIPDVRSSSTPSAGCEVVQAADSTARPSSSSSTIAKRAGRHDLGGRHRDQPRQPAGQTRSRTRRSSASTRSSAPARRCTASTRPTCSGRWSISPTGEVVNRITVDGDQARRPGRARSDAGGPVGSRVRGG